MDLRQIQYFVALCEEENITKVARRLHVVQPAVSMQIRKLETDFGVVLFERTAQGVYANALAKSLYPKCIKVLEEVGAIRQQLRGASGTIAGNLAVGVPPSLACGTLHDLLIGFSRDFPNVHVQCHEGYSANLIEWVSQGVLDFAVISVLKGERRLKFWPLLTEDMMVVSHRDLPVDRRDVIRATELARFKLVLPSSNNHVRILIDAEFERAGLSLPPDIEVDSLSTVMNMVETPEWVSILPATALRKARSQRKLAVRRLIEPDIQRTLVVAFQPAKEPSVAGQKFIQALERLLKDDSSNSPNTASGQVIARIKTS